MKWFDRQFDFSIPTDQADAICHRLRHTPARLQQLLSHAAESLLDHKPAGKWSVKEHVGHLSVLEPLWRARVTDIEGNKEMLTPADLDNKTTTEAGFNNFHLAALLDRFLKERAATLTMLNSIDIRDSSRASLHPRLQQHMRFVDHLWFVAEHDDHHVNIIREMIHQQ